MKKLEPSPVLPIHRLSRSAVSMLETDALVELINKINEQYYYWDKVKFQPIPDGITHKELWSLIKLRRKTTPYNISFGRYKFYWNLNAHLQELLHFLDLNIGGSLESSSIINKEDKNRYLLSSIMEEAIASSQIEGAVTTRRHAKEMLRKNIKPRNKSEQMIFNNYITIQKILLLKSEKITLSNFLHVHKLVTTNTLYSEREEGFLRDNDEIKVIDTVDGSTVHTPPANSELPGLLKDLFRFFNEDDNKVFVHPIIKACILHFMVGFIHPFTDGNGRTARALFYWYLLKKGYWLTEYLSISRLILKSKASYAMAFLYTENDENDLTYFISYKLRTMKNAFEELRAYIKRKNEEKKQLTDFLGVDGLNYRQALILEWYRDDSELLLTISETEKRLGVSYMTARLNLNELVSKGYLQSRKIDKKSIGFVRGEKFDLLIGKGNRVKKIELRKLGPSLFD
jgi:Fic family protein